MQLTLAFIIILLATLENVWPIIAGFQAAPKGVVFLGTIHHSGDYFYYLSQFAQGATHWLMGRDLYTSESVPPVLVGWSNIFFGHIFHLVGFSQISAYHTSVIILTILLMACGYRLAFSVFGSRRPSILTLYLFVLYHAFPIRDHGTLTYSDYWNNYAIPNVRLGGVPHQLFTAIISIIALFGIIDWLKASQKRQWGHISILTVSGLMLASLQPVLWALLVISSGATLLIYGLSQKYKLKQLSTLCIPVICIGIGGIFPALYLTKLFSQLPFLQLKLWESVQQNQLSFSHFILATGPIFLIAIIAVPSFLKAKTPEKLILAIFAGSSLLLSISPIPALIGITQVRFMSTLTILAFSIIAAYGLWKCFHGKPLIIILALLTAILLPSHLKTISLTSAFDPGNAYQYLSASDYTFLQTAAKVSKDDEDVFLIIWPYDVIFPGLTGRRSFNGHTLLTIHSAQKDSMSQLFFDGSMSEVEMRNLLITNHVGYVLGYTWSPKLELLPFLTRVTSSPNLVLYRVDK